MLRVCVLAAIVLCPISFSRADAGSSCRPIVEALEAVQRVNTGMTRADLEKDFQLDGGISFPTQATYTYRKCRYVKIDVEFQRSKEATGVEEAPKDVITKISKAYLDYPRTD
jgi:hypothetical protein